MVTLVDKRHYSHYEIVEDISPRFTAGLMLKLEALLGRKVDVATEAALKERIRERVLQEAIT